MKTFAKVIGILAFGTIAFIALVIFLASPAMNDINTINSVVKQRKTEREVLLQQIQAFKNAQADLKNATRKDEIANALVVKEDLVVPIKELETAANDTGTSMSLILKDIGAKDKPSNVTSKRKDIDEIPYEIAVVNDYNGIIRFLGLMEHLPHFTEVSKISLSAETDSVNNTIIHTGRVYGQINAVFFIKSSKP